ncbi:DUF6482 family protein [Vibrio metschnikovii]|uniref:DUF6482 family protein n=1 Tax=Vibrio metschnikovii TaxID=28172 RepID=UPI001C2F3815|nr:DUF6482 family protein [Vibrio metschnikovii]
MRQTLTTLEQYFYINKLIIHALDMALYQASVIIDDQEYWVVDNNDSLLKTHSIVEMQKRCRKLNTQQQVLRHQSPYDEMIGTPIRQGDNTLEVPLRDNGYY